MANIPPSGTPGVFDPRNPTLIPNFNRSVFTGTSVDHQSPADYLAANPRVNAQATATVSGSVSTGDILTLEISNPIFQNPVLGNAQAELISHSYTVLAGDTVSNIAEEFAKLFNDDTTAQAVGIEVDAVLGVLTFNHPGPIGNLSVLSVPGNQPSTITVGGTALTGDALNLLFNSPALGPVVAATAQAEIGGTWAVGDTAALTFTNSSVASLPITKTYTAIAGDTFLTVAAGLVALVNADTTLGAAGIQASVIGGVITCAHQGAIGNSTVLSDSKSSTNGTIALLPTSGDFAGGSGQPGGVLVTFNATNGNSTTQLATGLKNAINADAELAAAGITATSSSAVITLTVPAAAEPLVVTGFVNTISPLTAAITGSVAAADQISLTLTNAAIAGGSATVSYTALLGATTTSFAAGLAAAINANAALTAAGISATNTTNTVNIAYQAVNGQIRISSSVVVGSETVTLSTTPTETLTLASTASEAITIGSGATAITSASATATIGGSSFVSSDTVALTFTNAGVTGFPITKTYTLGAGESATTIATGLKNLINADATLQAAYVAATSSAGVLTITQQGTIGNTTVLSQAVTGTGNETVTFSPSNGHMAGGAGTPGGKFTGGSGAIFAVNNFTFRRDNVMQAYFAGQPYNPGYPVLLALVTQGYPIV